jgi:hypothetical protein
MFSFNFDGLVKSLQTHLPVIPVKTGIQSFQWVCRFWIPACAGMTTFYEIINFEFSGRKEGCQYEERIDDA